MSDNNKPLTAEQIAHKMAEEQTALTPDLPVHMTELGFALRVAAEVERQAKEQTAALREELEEQKARTDLAVKDAEKWSNKWADKVCRNLELRDGLTSMNEELEAVKKEAMELKKEKPDKSKIHFETDYEDALFGWQVKVQTFLSRLISEETKPVKDTLNVLEILSKISPERSKEAFGLSVTDWSLPEWACALAGEVGELCNFIKKSNRDGKDRTEDIGKECADVAIYLDLLCTRAGINLQSAIISKFNEVSDRLACSIKFPASPPESSNKNEPIMHCTCATPSQTLNYVNGDGYCKGCGYKPLKI